MNRVSPPSLNVPLLSALLATLWSSMGSAAPSHNYWLAMQEEYGASRGFTLSLRTSSETEPLTLSNTQLQLGVASTQWRYLTVKPSAGWQFDRDYVVKVVISSTGAELLLDGQSFVSSGGFRPPLELEAVRAGYVYDNSGTPNFMVRQTALRLSTSSGKVATASLPAVSAVPPEVYLFDPHTPVWLPWRVATGETLTIETTFRFIRRPALTSVAPFIDRWGQSIHAQWSGKVTSDQQILDAAVDEKNRHQAWGLPTDYDQYGGYTRAWKEQASPYYRVVRRDAHWWLITPAGTPCFYFGVDYAPGTAEGTRVTGRDYLFSWLPGDTDPLKPAWSGNMFRFGVANLIRKHGSQWASLGRDNLLNRMKYWGFSGVGKWSGDIERPVPRVQVLRRDGVPTLGNGTDAKQGHPDIFDPTVRAAFLSKIQKDIAAAKYPEFVIGWSVNNEHDEIILTGEIPTILAKGATVPAKKALVDHALVHLYANDLTSMAAAWKVSANPLTRDAFYAATNAQPPAADIEALRRFFADAYYKFVYDTVKSVDAHRLYMGFWILPGWWENEEDFRLMARHVDVIGFDRYAFTYDDDRLQRLLGEADKPAILGEFSFPAHYSATRGFGTTTGSANDDAHAGQLYEKWTEAAARDPYLIGQMWFQYRDQPITGRNDENVNQLVLGESLAFGLVDITDRPKWPLVTSVRQANLKAVSQRLEGRAIFQAENAARSGTLISTGNIGYTGTGYVDFANASGDYLEWTVNVTTPGIYRLVFRYANGGGAQRPLELRVDNVAAGVLPFAHTASWGTWSTQSHKLSLTAGTHKIRLTATGASGGNIDYLQLTDTGAR